jgi:energy-coupling factor transporter ATP-binding protein EcfA2
MLILNNVLINEGYNVFILDEPELSVGNEYINNIIVPRLKELSNLNKKIIIATHDANIGVRTLPLQTIYRVDKGSNKYETFLGNPFTDNLVCYGNESKVLNWSEVTLKVLEGGRNAFNERGVIYGDKRN